MKASVFTIPQQQSIRLDQFIFHIILAEEETPRYLDRVNLTETQKNFFIQRFIDASTGTKFRFTDPENSNFHNSCQQLFGSEDEFLTSSRRLTSGFHEVHKKSANNGVFIISVVSIEVDEVDVQLAFLIKMDHTAVFQYKLEGRVARFEEIINTVVEEKSAMQKVAIVDLSGQFSWDVLATDRTKSDDVAGYFKNFLTVTELEPASRLTRTLVREVKKWARGNFVDLPMDSTPEYFGDKAADFMLGGQRYESEEYIKYVTSEYEEVENIRTLRETLRQHLIDIELYGVEFQPTPNSLASRDYRKTLKTAEGVKIEWIGSSRSKNLSIPSERNSTDNLYHITIKTNAINETQ